MYILTFIPHIILKSINQQFVLFSVRLGQAKNFSLFAISTYFYYYL